MSPSLETATPRAVGIRDIPAALLAPRRLFRRVEDVPVWGWPLILLLTSVTLIGYATVQTGLIDREIERQVRAQIARIDAEQRDVVERSELRELYAQEHKKGVFAQLLMRIRVIVAEPAKALASALLIAAVLYGAVALTGRKAEWHTLMTICVFAGFVHMLRLLLLLGLMLRYRTLAVDTSPALLLPLMAGVDGLGPTATAVLSGLLSACDPFRVWFWLVVCVWLSTTTQLPGWRAWLVCLLCWLVGAGARCGLSIAAVRGGMAGGGPFS
ncbi:MAG: hypothetical protein KKB50_06170 [Planctomycetes bacterium]|nr:hypothetical protein [Planctomycetota bacterium]